MAADRLLKNCCEVKMNLTDINEIKALLARNGFRFSKSIGQNFLCRSWVPVQIVQEAQVDCDTGVLEIGAGIGCLTAELSLYAKKVLCVELDTALEKVLDETLAGCHNVKIHYADVLKANLPQLVSEHLAGCRRLIVCANLPYNITSPVITLLLESRLFASITVMVQREVAQRICSQPGGKEYGAFSIFVKWHAEAKMHFDVSPDCFIPAPKVHSSVITLKTRTEPFCEVKDEKLMMKIVKAAFNQRRKTLYNALSNAYPELGRESIQHAIEAIGLSQTVRGEALSLSQFAALSDELS